MGSKLEGILATLLLIGFGAIVIGVLLTAASMLLPIPLPIYAVTGPLFLIGVLLVAGALIAGRAHEQGSISGRSKGPITIETCRVLAKYGIDELGQMQFEELDSYPGIKLYVRLWFPDGKQVEYRCPLEVFSFCADGMWGSAVVQGDWLGQFKPKPAPGSDTSQNPYV